MRRNQIGIDEVVLKDFVVSNIDEERLKGNVNAVCEYMAGSPLKTMQGSGVRLLRIRDERIGELLLSYTKNNFDTRKEYQMLTKLTMKSSARANIYNLNAEQFKARVKQVESLLNVEYGIRLELEQARISRLELNVNIELKEKYENYSRCIKLLAQLASMNYRPNVLIDQSKYATWHKVTSEKDSIETMLIKNNAIEFKVYDKSAELKANDGVGVKKNIMRIEYVFKQPRTIEAWIGRTVAEVTNGGIKSLFMRYFTRDVVAKVNQWSEDNEKDLLDVVQSHKLNKRTWVNQFIREVRQYEGKNGLPLLFDLGDMRKVLNRLESTESNNQSHKYKRFEEQCVFEDDLIGHRARLEEILTNVERIG